MKILKPLFFGLIAALGALFLELFLATFFSTPQDLFGISSKQITFFLAVTVLIEELMKLAFIYRDWLDLKISSATLSESRKIIFFHSFFVGIGFSIIELLFIFFGLQSICDVSDFKLAISGILLIHTATSSIMGYLLARPAPLKFFTIPNALILAVTIHFFYNLLVVYSANPFFIFFYLLFLALIFSGLGLRVCFEKAKK